MEFGGKDRRMSETLDAVTEDGVDTERLAQQLLAQAKEQGIGLVGPGGLLNQVDQDCARGRVGSGDDRARRL